MKIVNKTSFEYGALTHVNENQAPPGVISAYYVNERVKNGFVFVIPKRTCIKV